MGARIGFWNKYMKFQKSNGSRKSIDDVEIQMTKFGRMTEDNCVENIKL